MEFEIERYKTTVMVFREAVKLKKEGILEYVRSNIVGGKKVYLFKRETRKFGRMEETKI